MKFLKLFLGILVALIAIVLIISLLLPGSFDVQRTITIEQPKTVVYDYIKYLKNQDNFSKWTKIDPAMKKIFHGEDGTVGFVSAWSSDHKDVGKGEQEIIKIEEGLRIDYELRFIEPWESTSPAFMSVDSISATQTIVTWGFHGEMAVPMNLMLLFMDMEENLGDDLAGGLDNLKQILETSAVTD